MWRTRSVAASRKPDDAPVVQRREVVDQIAADYALGAHDERDFVVCSHDGVR